MNARLDRIRKGMANRDLEALLVTSDENRRYISGFTGSAGTLVITHKSALLATDFRYIEQASQQSPDFEIVHITGGLDWLKSFISGNRIKNVGFERNQMSVDSHANIVSAFKDLADTPEAISLIPAPNLVEELRSIKYPDELDIITRAIEISDEAFAQVAPTIEPGQTESDVAWRLEKAMRELGAESVSFETIVATGPNAALPHHRPSDQQIREGEPLIIDMGARYKGYCSDLSRTLCLGQQDETFRKVYDTVLGAQLTAITTVTEGMTGAEADALARKVIAEANYGENFGHSLGHGVGLAVHEQPGVGPRSANKLSNQMAFTIEPGIYISGWGGVRIEDIVFLENGKAKVISKAPKLNMRGS